MSKLGSTVTEEQIANLAYKYPGLTEQDMINFMARKNITVGGTPVSEVDGIEEFLAAVMDAGATALGVAKEGAQKAKGFFNDLFN